KIAYFEEAYGEADEKDAICSRILDISAGKPYFASHFAVR
ncbi:MAG: hypothetical protein Greene07144_1062, partial [Parcubacteria group bacterium Greene0714_4]